MSIDLSYPSIIETYAVLIATLEKKRCPQKEDIAKVGESKLFSVKTETV
jgi:hypothetical protein